MTPLTKARHVRYARCWGLWRRWLRAERAGLLRDRTTLHRLWAHLCAEHEEDYHAHTDHA